MDEKEKSVDTKEVAKILGRAGGNKTLKKYGKKHYREMNRKRWDSAKNSPEVPSI